jgi:M6 family metalloprotease-like protein
MVMPRKCQLGYVTALAGLCLLLAARPTQAAPYRGESRFFSQPNGAEVEVRLFGTELYIRAESVEGYAVAIDNASGWICYAEPAGDGGLRATGIRYRGPASPETLARLARRGIVPGLRASAASVAATVTRVRQSLGSEPHAGGLQASYDIVAEARYNPTLGSGKGLVVLVDFEDRVGSIPVSEYEKGFNGDTYDVLGSIRSWIEAISYTKYTASHTVVGYMRAAYPTSHYLGGTEFDYSASRELMKQVFTYIDDNVDLTDYATNGATPSLVVVYPGAEIAKVWATGLWPHSGEGGYTTSEGVRIPNAFISNGGTRTPMSLDTFRHELGHSLFNWPDTYDYDDDSASAGGFATETTLPCAVFRAWSGWLNVIDVVGVNQSYSLAANGDTCLRYKNAANASEFFIVEYMKKESPKRSDAPDDGLLIWHVDEKGDNSLQDMTPTKHYQLSVEQADGLFELEKNGTKRAGDLFHAGYKDAFDDTTTPNSKWWNATVSGFAVCNIGNLDPSMNVTVGCAGGSDGGTAGSGGSGGSNGSGGSGSGGSTGGTGGARDAGRDGARDGALDARDGTTGGGPGTGGTASTGGKVGSGGASSSGGMTSTGGTGSGGSVASGGSAGTGGAAGTGGSAPAGGASAGGVSATGVSSPTGGGSGSGGAGGSGTNRGDTASGGAGSSSSRATTKATADVGCTCAAGGRSLDGAPALVLVLLLGIATLRRRAKRPCPRPARARAMGRLTAP